MYPSTVNSQQGQSQLKKSGRNKQLDCVNPNSNEKPLTKRPYKNPPRQNFSGPRGKSFSKNEKKVESRNYKQHPAQSLNNGGDHFAVQDLLNFQYSSSSGRQVENCYNGSRFNSLRNSNYRKPKSFFNKEEYLQATCQFVVIGSADEYYVNTVDPDLLVDWEKVKLVYAPSHEPPNCPICLFPPRAAKMTKCGHIYCWSCMLHYLHLDEEKSWKKCPICHEAVHEKDLKSVKPYVQQKFDRLDSISMKLIRRPKNSILTSPGEDEATKFEFSSWYNDMFDSSSKIMLATREQVVKELLMKEKEVLQSQLEKEKSEDNGEAIFISMALSILEEEIRSLSASNGSLYEGESAGSDPDCVSESLSSLLSDSSLSCKAEAPFSDEESSLIVNHENKSNTRLSESSVTSNEQGFEVDTVQSPASSFQSEEKPKNDYFFYQALDGQNIFLHSINARCLIEEYGSLDFGPSRIKGDIIDFECFTMTKELRKRFRYLSHLPLSSEFMICELILKPPLLSKRTIHNFMPEFKNRKAMRSKKVKEQQRFDREANVIESKKYGFHVESEYEDFELDISNAEDFPSNVSPEFPLSPVSSQSEQSLSASSAYAGPSFAQMLNTKAEITPPRPVKKDVYRDIGYQSPALNCGRNISADDEDGPDVYAPDFKQTFSAAMFATPVKENAGEGSKLKNKKKKEKGMLLFGTGGQRKY